MPPLNVPEDNVMLAVCLMPNRSALLLFGFDTRSDPPLKLAESGSLTVTPESTNAEAGNACVSVVGPVGSVNVGTKPLNVIVGALFTGVTVTVLVTGTLVPLKLSPSFNVNATPRGVVSGLLLVLLNTIERANN